MCLWSLVSDGRLEVAELERFANVHSNVFRLCTFLQKGVQEEELLVILLSAYERVNRDSVVEIEGEGHDRIIHDNHVRNLSIDDNIEVLDVKFLNLDAVLPI